MPKIADPNVRVALIDSAARITAEEGRDALTLRRLAAEVGASTMAIYTHFGGMDDLRRAVRREGFDRLATHLAEVAETSDPVTDLAALGGAYYLNATTNPNLYRAMFLDGPIDEQDADMGLETYRPLTGVVERCIATGRMRDGDVDEIAHQLWATMHGAITLQLAGMMTPEAALTCCVNSARTMLRAHGDSAAAISRSFKRAAAPR